MACYVDTVRHYPNAGLRFTDFCHLMADTRTELHALASDLGLPQRIFQDHPWRWHYDLPSHLRPQAIALGAREVDMHYVGALLASRKAALRTGSSEPASSCEGSSDSAGSVDSTG
jgi:hypothetical protein